MSGKKPVKKIPAMKPKRQPKTAPVRDWLARRMFGQKWRYR